METACISEKDNTSLKMNETFETGTSSTKERNSIGPQPYGDALNHNQKCQTLTIRMFYKLFHLAKNESLLHPVLAQEEENPQMCPHLQRM